MTARGARAEGENVYLYENNNNTFEYIPAQGAKGGESLRKGKNSGGNGINGYAGSKRQTGGGGSGAVWASDENPIAISGAGGTGTSYSGGAGGDGCNQNSGLTIQAEDGSSTGGKGGNGRGYRASSSWATRLAGGGAGNPGGIGGQNGFGNAQAGTGENGTGGLLVIYSKIEEKPNTAQIVWESSDENIVTVDQNGKIKYVNPGTVTITCTAKTKIGT